MKKELCLLFGGIALAIVNIVLVGEGVSKWIWLPATLVALVSVNAALWMQRARHNREYAKWEKLK